jgi:hypothetical protein
MGASLVGFVVPFLERLCATAVRFARNGIR